MDSNRHPFNLTVFAFWIPLVNSLVFLRFGFWIPIVNFLRFEVSHFGGRLGLDFEMCVIVCRIPMIASYEYSYLTRNLRARTSCLGVECCPLIGHLGLG